MRLFILLLVTSVVAAQQPCCSQQPYILQQLQQIAGAIGGENITVNADFASLEYYLAWLATQTGQTQYKVHDGGTITGNLSAATYYNLIASALYQSSDFGKPTLVNTYITAEFPSGNVALPSYTNKISTSLYAPNTTSTFGSMFVNYYNAAVYWLEQIVDTDATIAVNTENTVFSLDSNNGTSTLGEMFDNYYNAATYWFQQIAQASTGSTQAIVNTLTGLGYSRAQPTALISTISPINGSAAYWANMVYAALFDIGYTVSSSPTTVGYGANTTIAKLVNAIMNQGYNAGTGKTTVETLNKIDEDLLSANSSNYGLGFMFSNYYNAAMYWFQSINTNLQSILNALVGGKNLSAFSPSYFMFISVFGDITSDQPLVVDYTDYPNPGLVKNVVNGLEDIRIGASITNFGVGAACYARLKQGDGTYISTVTDFPVVLDYSQPFQELDRSNTFDTAGNPIFLAGGGSCKSGLAPGTGFITYRIYYYSSNPKLVTMTVPGCAPSDIPLILSIYGAATDALVPGPNFFTVNLDSLIGYTDVTTTTQWLTTGTLTALEAEWHSNSALWDHWNCAGTDSAPNTVCNVTVCINPTNAFRPSIPLAVSAFSNAPWYDNGGAGRFINNMVWPYQRGYGQIKLPVAPELYGVYTSNNGGGTSGAILARQESSSSGSLTVYLCSTKSGFEGVKLAKGKLTLPRSTSERMQNILVSYGITDSDDVYVEWLDFEWDRDFNSLYSYYKWQSFAFDTAGEQTLYIVTELDTTSCYTTLGTEAIPQAFWALRLEMLIDGGL